MAKFKDWESQKKKKGKKQLVTSKEAPIKPLADFARETFQARRDGHEIFKEMKSKEIQARLLYLAWLSFKIIKIILKSFPDKKELKEFITIKPVLPKKKKNCQRVFTSFLLYLPKDIFINEYDTGG